MVWFRWGRKETRREEGRNKNNDTTPLEGAGVSQVSCSFLFLFFFQG